MRSSFRALVVITAVAVLSACANVTAPNDDDAECGSVVTGSNTCIGGDE